MKRYSPHALTGLFLATLLVVTTAGVSAAKVHHLATVTLKTVLSSASIPLGSTATDTATVTGKASAGSPTGTVTFGVCGPTASVTPCTAADVTGSAPGALSPGAHHRSTATATVDPPATGWYCLLDQYSGDGHYKPAVDNATATECFQVTGTASTTPTLTSSLDPATVTAGNSSIDTATVTGNSSAGSPTGTVTFGVCGPTTNATPCTAANVAGSAPAELSPHAGDSSTAQAQINPNATGWYCLLDQYSGDANYSPVSDNDTTTECLHVTGSTSTATPTLTSSLSPPTVTAGNSSIDTATVTGNSSGSPTGTVTFSACGPTATPTPCTAANVAGSAPAELSPQSGNSSTAQAQINPPTTGWYCLLDQYSGDANYSPVSDNDTATECLHVTGSTSTAIPTLTSSLSPPTVTAGNPSIDTATVTGNPSSGSPTGSATFGVCGPTTNATPCTAADVVASAAVELSPQAGNRSTAPVEITPYDTGWYCLLDQYSGDANYSPVSDNDTTTECLHVTGSSSSARAGAAALVAPAPGSRRGRSIVSSTA
jgi:hypothetical protein